ncbi:MAG TPA: DUF6364 family protein [Gemmatimonadaceae bacterium]|nr:DUF6364 family protein [Gemmatimonadaceae bacterium]
MTKRSSKAKEGNRAILSKELKETKQSKEITGGGTEKKRAKNLLLDVDALERAEAFSRRKGTTVSRLVSDFLRSLPDDEAPLELPPVVRRLYGLAAGGTTDREAYREYLYEKYGAHE